MPVDVIQGRNPHFIPVVLFHGREARRPHENPEAVRRRETNGPYTIRAREWDRECDDAPHPCSLRRGTMRPTLRRSAGALESQTARPIGGNADYRDNS